MANASFLVKRAAGVVECRRKGLIKTIVKKTVRFPDAQRNITFDEPTECPLCKHAIKAQELHIAGYVNNDNQDLLAVLYLCKNCFQPFVAHFAMTENPRTGYLNGELMLIGPSSFTPKEFDPKISALSPSFCEIYNQASEAETLNLDQIAGIGYRKALEFLVKDFCVHQHPDEENPIKGKLLGDVIRDYVDNSRIKTLAQKASWIGNDETHYIRKHEDRDINDMKNFIQAMVYFVGMELIAEDAESMPRV